jgi:hypothetical protein
MIKTYKNFIIFFLIIIVTLLFFLKKYNDIIKQNQVDILVSNNVELINSEISHQKKYALSLAILFSKNQHIIDALKLNQPQQLKNELDNLLTTISNYTKQQNIQIQVHTKALKVFVRSWENKDTGLNLTSFRHGLVKVKQTKQPFVSNELGKRFNIKAISPIFDEKEYIGSLEVIMDYSSLKERLAIAGIEVLPILNSKFLNIAAYHKNNKKLYDYVIIEKQYNENIYNLLVHNKDILKQKQFYYEVDDTIITLIPLGNIEGNAVGYLVASFKNTNQNFNYLPTYEYKGIINADTSYTQEIKEQKNIIIK